MSIAAIGKACPPGENQRRLCMVTGPTPFSRGWRTCEAYRRLVRKNAACGRLSCWRLIRHADAVTINHLPTLPTREQQDQNYDKRQDQAGRQDGGVPMIVARIPIVELDQHRKDVAAGVQPRVRQIADLSIPQHVDQSHDRGERGHDEADAQQPKRGARPKVV